MERVNEELLCFSTMLRTIAHSVRAQFGTLDDAHVTPPPPAATSDAADKKATADDTPPPKKPSAELADEQRPLSLDETIELLDLAGQLLESDNNAFRIRALLLETRPNLVEVLVGILASNPASVLPPSLGAAGHRASASLAGAASLRYEHEQIQRRFTSLQWKAMSTLARACALAAPTEATAAQFGFVLDSFEVLTIALRYLVMEDAGVSLRTCAAEVLFLCVTKLQLAQRAAATPDAVDTIVFQLAESEVSAGAGAEGGGGENGFFSGAHGGGGEDTMRCYLVGALHAIGPIDRLLSADFVDVAIGVLRQSPVYACAKILQLLALLCKRSPHFVPSSLPQDRVLLLAQALGSVLVRLGEHPDVVLAACRVIEICAIVSALAVEDEAIVRANQRAESDRGNPFAGTTPSPYTQLSHRGGGRDASAVRQQQQQQQQLQQQQQRPEEGPARFLIFFTHPQGPWRHLLIAGKTDMSLVEARAHQMRAMRTLLQCLIHPGAMQRLADELGRDLPLFSALLSAPLRLPPFHDEAGAPYVAEASLCLTFLMAKVPSFRSAVRRAAATFPAWLQNLEPRLVAGMEAGLQGIAGEITTVQLVDVCGNLLNSVGFVDRFAPRAWGDVQALEVCVARLYEFQLRVDPNEPRPPLANSSAADDDGAPFVAVFVDTERKAMVLTTGVLAYAICLSFQEVDPRLEPYLTRHHSQSEQDGLSFSTDPSNLAAGLVTPGGGQAQQQQQRRGQSALGDPFSSSRGVSSAPGGGVGGGVDGAGTSTRGHSQALAAPPPANANAFVTGDVEDVAASTDDGADGDSEAQSDSYHAASAAAKHHFAAKPSPYALHAMRNRQHDQQQQQQQQQPPASTVKNQWAVPPRQNSNSASRQPSLQPPQSKPPAAAAAGFVQRNVLSGRFEPVVHNLDSAAVLGTPRQGTAAGAAASAGAGPSPAMSVVHHHALPTAVRRPSTSRSSTPRGGGSRRGTPTGRTKSAWH